MDLVKWLENAIREHQRKHDFDEETRLLAETNGKYWIKGAIKRKGALRATLGIKEGETIPTSILNRIAKAEIGTKISFHGKTLTVTAKLKRRALLALKLGKMKKGSTSETVEWLLREKGVK